jgi:hypothetical protein
MSRLRDYFRVGDGKRALGPDTHLTDHLLLLAIDGELTPAETEKVRQHLEACWSCRVRKEHLEHAITEVVEYQNARLRPYLPPSSTARNLFLARLEQMAVELGRPPLWQRCLTAGNNMARATLSFRPAWIAATVLIALGFLFSYLSLVRGVPAVSAAELLQNAKTSEPKALRNVKQPVVYQKLRIQMGGHAITRTIYRDMVGGRKASQTEGGESNAAAVRKALQPLPLDWDNPLSASAYDAWRNGLPDKQDTVKVLPEGLLELKTSADAGPVREASLTVRSADYHPVEEGVVLRDNERIEIAELSYQVFELPQVNLALFATPPPVLPIPQASARVSTGPSESQLAETELEIRIALHSAGADLGEEVEVERAPRRGVVVTGLTQNAQRKEELVAVLHGIPFAESRLQTVDEAVEKQSTTNLSGRPVLVTVESTPLLDKELKTQFPNAPERAEFVNQTLALTQGATARAWALRRLSERYTPRELALLNNASQHKLETLLSDHVSSLREDVTSLQTRLGSILPSFSTGSAVPGSQASEVQDWRGRVKRVNSSIQTVNEVISVLLGGTVFENADASGLKVQLRSTLAEVELELRALDEQVHKGL